MYGSKDLQPKFMDSLFRAIYRNTYFAIRTVA